MKKTLAYILLLSNILFGVIIFSKTKSKELDSTDSWVITKYEYLQAIDYIKENDLSRREINQLLAPYVIKIVENHPHLDYKISDKELAGIILTIAQTETSTKNGEPFRSILFLRGNNMGGIKARRGDPYIVTYTYEYINGKRVKIKDKFYKFLTPYQSIIFSLDLFDSPNYRGVHEVNDYKEFFKELKKSGYFTHPSWDKVWIKYYKEYYD